MNRTTFWDCLSDAALIVWMLLAVVAGLGCLAFMVVMAWKTASWVLGIPALILAIALGLWAQAKLEGRT